MNKTLHLLYSHNIYVMTWEAALKILELSRDWQHKDTKKHEPLLMASGAVCSILHEAWQHNSDSPAFLKNLNDAQFEVHKVRQNLTVVKDMGLLDVKTAKHLEKMYAEIHEKMDEVIKHIEKKTS
jgi:four helix bundle protein